MAPREEAAAAQAAAAHEHKADMHRRLVAIIELLHGLPVGEAEHLLNEAKRNMKAIVAVDATGPGFAEMVRTFHAMFGNSPPPARSN